MPLHIGVIGCGRIAREVHLRVLQTLPGVRVVALAEPDANALHAASQLALDAACFLDVASLLAHSPLEAVIIALPNALHAQTAIEAFEARKHVYLEKPLGLNPDEGRKVVDAWQRAGTIGAIGFNYRFNPLLQEAKRELRNGAIGKLIAVRSSFCAPLGQVPAWKTQRQSGGGVLLDLASHHLDLVRYISGQEVVQSWAQARSLQHESDTAAIELSLQDGTLVQSFFSQGAVERDLWEFEGQDGRLRVDRYAMASVEVTRAGELGIGARLRRASRSVHPAAVRRSTRYTLRKLREPGNEPSYRAALGCFVGAVQNNKANSLPNPVDGLRNLEIIAALEEAMQTGCRIALPK